MRANISLTPKQLGTAIASVAVGGALGTAIRDLILKLEPTRASTGWTASTAQAVHPSWFHSIPWVLLAINFVGVFVATRLLLRPLRHHDPNDPTRLLVITGFLGGLTSYSGLYVDFNVLWHLSVPGCLLVGLMAILSGAAAAWLAMWRLTS